MGHSIWAMEFVIHAIDTNIWRVAHACIDIADMAWINLFFKF